MTESNLIEYKLTLSDSFEKEAVAFLNSKTGGKVYFGINDDGERIGLENVPIKKCLSCRNFRRKYPVSI